MVDKLHLLSSRNQIHYFWITDFLTGLVDQSQVYNSFVTASVNDGNPRPDRPSSGLFELGGHDRMIENPLLNVVGRTAT